MKIDLNDFKKPTGNGISKTINLSEKNFNKVKRQKINLSALINFYLESNDKKFLALEFNERADLGGSRKVTTVYIEQVNISKAEAVKLSYLTNYLLDNL